MAFAAASKPLLRPKLGVPCAGMEPDHTRTLNTLKHGHGQVARKMWTGATTVLASPRTTTEAWDAGGLPPVAGVIPKRGGTTVGSRPTADFTGLAKFRG